MAADGFIEGLVGDLTVLRAPGQLECPHGFTGTALPQKGSPGLPEAELRVCEQLGFERIVLLNQVHGDAICDLRDESTRRAVFGGARPDADALIAQRGDARPGIAIGIKTADCLPILVAGPTLLAAIHAGWRGLALGIIGRVLQLFEAAGETAPLVLIGPGAGACDYLVGAEVISQIGDSARSTAAAEAGKFLLDLEHTAEIQVVRAFPRATVIRSARSTISDPRFASHRRDRELSGRNVAFIGPIRSEAASEAV